MDKVIRPAGETGGEILAVGYFRGAAKDSEAKASTAAQKVWTRAFAH